MGEGSDRFIEAVHGFGHIYRPSVAGYAECRNPAVFETEQRILGGYVYMSSELVQGVLHDIGFPPEVRIEVDGTAEKFRCDVGEDVSASSYGIRLSCGQCGIIPQ